MNLKFLNRLVVFCLFFSSALSQSKNYGFDNVVIFGDSLSDNGNIIQIYPDYDNFYSTRMVAGGDINQVYSEYLARALTGKILKPSYYGGANYAITGATAINNKDQTRLIKQYEQYLLKYTVNPNNVYIIWAGGNDFALSFSEIRGFKENINGSLSKKLAQEIGNISKSFYSQGAKNIIVPNLFDMGRTTANIKVP